MASLSEFVRQLVHEALKSRGLEGIDMINLPKGGDLRWHPSMDKLDLKKIEVKFEVEDYRRLVEAFKEETASE